MTSDLHAMVDMTEASSQNLVVWSCPQNMQGACDGFRLSADVLAQHDAGDLIMVLITVAILGVARF